MTRDPKHLVAAAYNQIADAYLSRYGVSSVREKWLRRLLARLPDRRGCVLDLGCGAGLPVAQAIFDAGHVVVGVDSSSEQIARAQVAVPGATFTQSDMSEIEFEADTFDAVGAFYSVTHIPAKEQGNLFKKVALWLKPGGSFVASLGTGAAGDWTGEWMGVNNFFGHNDEATSLASLNGAGFDVREAEVEQQDNEDASFLWIVAVKRQGASV